MPSFEVTESVEINVEFEVFCGNCGEGLRSQSKGGNTTRRVQPYLMVDPCEKCLALAKNESFENGRDSRDSRDDEVSDLLLQIDSQKDEILDLKVNQDFDGGQ